MSGQRNREGSSSHGRQRRSSSHSHSWSHSRSARAGLVFSVSHIEHLLREGRYGQRLTSSTPVFLTAIIQYLTSTILELAAEEAQKRGCRNITPQLVDMAIHNNPLLSGIFGNVTISQEAPGFE